MPDHPDEEGEKNRPVDLEHLRRSRAGFKSALTRKRNEVRSALAAATLDQLKDERDGLNFAWAKFLDAHEQYHGGLGNEEEVEQSFIYCENEELLMNELMTKINQRIAVLDTVTIDDIKPRDSASQAGSRRSQGSSRSSVKDKLADQLAKRKALEARLGFLEQERQLEQKKLQITQEEKVLHVRRELTEVRAREEVYASLGDEAGGIQNSFRYGEQAGSPSQYLRHPKISPPPTSPGASPDSDDPEECMKRFLRCQEDQSKYLKRMFEERNQDITSLTLPQPEMPMFDGNPMEYCLFISAFSHLIEGKTGSSSARLYYLIQYTTGEVKELLKSCLTKEPDDGYAEARRLLRKFYGQPYRIATAYVDKATNGPPIQTEDAAELQRFSILLTSCKNTLEQLGYMGKVENPDSLRRIVLRLPYDLKRRWRSKADDITECLGREIKFSDIADFVAREVRTASHPLFGDILERSSSGVRTGDSSRNVKSRTTLATGADASNESTSNNYVPESAYRCPMCDGEHQLKVCPRFKDLTYEERVSYCRERGFCFNCLNTKSRHIARQCREPGACETCKGRHATLLHLDNFHNNNKTVLASCGDAYTNKICLPIVAVKVKAQDSFGEITTFALLDNASNTSFCTASLLRRLNLSGPRVSYSLSTVEKENSGMNGEVVQLTISDHDESNFIELPEVFSRPTLPLKARDRPTQADVDTWPHLRGIQLPCFNGEVELLIGVDNHVGLEPLEIRRSEGGGPFAVRTVLGWTINGPIGTNSRVASHTTNHVKMDQELTRRFEDFCDREFRDTVGHCESEEMSQADRKALNIMEKSVSLIDGSYTISLPFKCQPPQLPNNRVLAEHRLNSLKRKLVRDPVALSEYCVFMSNLVTQGYAEKVPACELNRDDGQAWYLPHHAVIHPQKKKVRVVFDCAAVYRGSSLNEQLLQGPDQTSSLLGVLLRFRQHPIAITADIESMFHRVRVTRSQCDMLRFLWWPEGNLNEPPVPYRMLVHLFGAVCSPSVCSFALRRTADDHVGSFDTDVIRTVKRNFYVDDGLKSVESVDDAVRMVHQLTELLSLGGFRLTKWTSNSADVIRTVPQMERASSVRELTCEKLPTEQVLGVYWDMQDDTLSFRVSLPDRPSSRRGILSMMSSIYDPLGFVTPVVLPVKMLLQELCRRKLGWDDEVPDELLKVWLQWLRDVPLLTAVKIQRCLKPPDFKSLSSCSLHHFSDASTVGYGAVSYLRVVNDGGQILCSFLMGKSRLTPMKAVTIPRLELSAATISVRLDEVLRRELELPIAQSYYWTDSTTVLKYVSNETKRFNTFVANRIATIRSGSEPEQWKFVRGAVNPADDASRGLNVRDFLINRRWQQGPVFLWRPECEWEEQPKANMRIDEDDPEVKTEKSPTCNVATVVHSTLDNLLNKFSSWIYLKKIVGWILRFKANARNKGRKSRDGDDDITPLSVGELDHAERAILQYVQRTRFPEEYNTLREATGGNTAVKKSSSLCRLDPFLRDGLLRIGGRLRHSTLAYDARHQLLLPKSSHVTRLLVRHYHHLSGHSGREHVLSKLREKYWVIGGNSLVRSVLAECTHCRRRQAAPEEQKMADLPFDRIEGDKPPFCNVGVDYFGPFMAKRGRSTVKRYGCIFTCLQTRAIHLEVAYSLDTDSFLNALRRFLSRRGNSVELIRSDNGTNFVAGEKEMRTSLAEWNQAQIHSFLLQREISWNFNPPAASHHGGVWERCIRTVRKVMNALLTDQILDDEGLATLMCEVEHIVNSRPITVVSSDPTDLNPLTPNDLLLPRPGPALPPGVFSKDDLYSRRRWKQVQYLADQFWVRWRREYLPLLQSRQKWQRSKKNLRTRDVVLLVDNNAPRGSWALGRVLEVFPGSDDRVRAVMVKTKDSVLTRPVTKCVLLVEAED